MGLLSAVSVKMMMLKGGGMNRSDDRLVGGINNLIQFWYAAKVQGMQPQIKKKDERRMNGTNDKVAVGHDMFDRDLKS